MAVNISNVRLAIIKPAMPVIGIGCWTSRLVVAFGIGNITILSWHRATVANLIDICGSPRIDFPILLAGRKALLFCNGSSQCCH